MRYPAEFRRRCRFQIAFAVVFCRFFVLLLYFVSDTLGRSIVRLPETKVVVVDVGSGCCW